MSKRNNLYVGKGGQAVVMAEFLLRGWNVAIPEVDVGDDLFVVRDSDGQFTRIQVKTAQGRSLKQGFAAQFSVPLIQMETDFTPDLYYVFVVRFENQWQDFLVFSREKLLEGHQINKLGSRSGSKVIFRFSYRIDQNGTNVKSGKIDLNRYKNDFATWPIIVQ